MPLPDAVFCGGNLPVSILASSDALVCASPHLALRSPSQKIDWIKNLTKTKVLLKHVPTKSLCLTQLSVDFGIIRLASALKPPCDNSSSTLKTFAIRATLGARICNARHVIAKCVILQVNREKFELFARPDCFRAWLSKSSVDETIQAPICCSVAPNWDNPKTTFLLTRSRNYSITNPPSLTFPRSVCYQ